MKVTMTRPTPIRLVFNGNDKSDITGLWSLSDISQYIIITSTTRLEFEISSNEVEKNVIVSE